jgi:hypothetical protein
MKRSVVRKLRAHHATFWNRKHREALELDDRATALDT